MNNLRQALAEAKALYEQGSLEVAGERFQAIAQRYADCSKAWFWLGM